MSKMKELLIDTMSKTKLHTWFERGRAHVELRDSRTDKTIVEWRDEAVDEAIVDGFLDLNAFVLGKLMRPELLHESACSYLIQTMRNFEPLPDFIDYANIPHDLVMSLRNMIQEIHHTPSQT